MATPLPQVSATAPAGPPIMFYDGECLLCNWVVHWVLPQVRAERPLLFAPLRGALWDKTVGKPPWFDAIAYVARNADGQTELTTGFSAVRRSVAYVRLRGWGWLRFVPKPLGDLGYWLIAKARKAPGKAQACPMPPMEQRKWLRG